MPNPHAARNVPHSAPVLSGACVTAAALSAAAPGRRGDFTPPLPAVARMFHPAIPRICRYREIRGPWQNPPAPGFRGVISLRNNLPLFIEKPREFTEIYRYLRKFHIRERSARRRHHTRVTLGSHDAKCGQMRGAPRPGWVMVSRVSQTFPDAPVSVLSACPMGSSRTLLPKGESRVLQ